MFLSCLILVSIQDYAYDESQLQKANDAPNTRLIYCFFNVLEQPWPAELPLIYSVDSPDGAVEALDMGVVFYSFSFGVISLMILSQV